MNIVKLSYIFLFILFTGSLWLQPVSAQVNNTPPYNGNDYQSAQGIGMNRKGFIHRYPNWVYPTNILAVWRKTRGGINPSVTPGVLTNPLRRDGTSLSYGLGIPANFTGHVPVFTEGNKWPHIGKNQKLPKQYNNLGTDAGPFYKNGKPVATREALVRNGINRVTIVNKTRYSYLVSAGVFPGNEQPGMTLTVINPYGKGQLPIPPKDWWTIRNLNTGAPMSAVPEVYSSVAGLNPLDALGWKHSSWSPKYKGGDQRRDFGTGGFAYTIAALFGRNDGVYDLSNTLFAGFHTNEGYDPLVSGDPGYGCAFYINGRLQAVMDIKLTGKYTAQAILVAQKKHHPGKERSFFDPNRYSHLKSIIGVQPNQKAELHYITHAKAQALIRQYSSNNNWKRVTHTYQSNTNANVRYEALPKVVSGSGNQHCPTPKNLAVTNIGRNVATLRWSKVASANNYEVRYRKKKSSTWVRVNKINDRTQKIQGLTANTVYEVQVKSNCGKLSNYSKTILFTTSRNGNATMCAKHGVSYIDDNTVRVYHKKENKRGIQHMYMCVGDNCYVPKEKNGYYYFDFNKKTTYTFVDMKLWKKYTYQFKFNHAGGFYTTGNVPFTFTRKSCDFISLKGRKNISKVKSVEVFPNPVNSVLNVKAKGAYAIYNSTGVLIYQGKKSQINISKWKKGTYILKSNRDSVQFIKE